MEIKKPAYHPDMRANQHRPTPKLSKDQRQEIYALWDRIQRSPKSREPSEYDVETFEESYRKCHCRQRWGA